MRRRVCLHVRVRLSPLYCKRRKTGSSSRVRLPTLHEKSPRCCTFLHHPSGRRPTCTADPRHRVVLVSAGKQGEAECQLARYTARAPHVNRRAGGS